MRVALPMFVFVLSAAFFFAGSAPAGAVTISPNFGGVAGSNDPGAFVKNIYEFALAASGILAFGVIVYGAIVYTLAAGNPGGQKEGKEWIKQALIGLLLLSGAVLILQVIIPGFRNVGGGIELTIQGPTEEIKQPNPGSGGCTSAAECGFLLCGGGQRASCVVKSGFSGKVCECPAATPTSTNPGPNPGQTKCTTGADCGGSSIQRPVCDPALGCVCSGTRCVSL